MDFIKDKENVISSVNELINEYGEPKELAQCIDELIFDWLVYFAKNNECADAWVAERISNTKAIRDFLLKIETK